jgi:hypothetical protein
VEHDACVLSLPSEGHLNWFFKKLAVSYARFGESR